MRLRWAQAKDRHVKVDTHDKYTQISRVEAPNIMESLKPFKNGAENIQFNSPMGRSKRENVTSSLLLNESRTYN